jgi:hypothetical protein
MQGLWLGAGSALSANQGQRIVSAAAAALRGTSLASRFRAREAELLLRAPGSHRTHVWAAAVVSIVCALCRLLVANRLSDARWSALWQRRKQHRGGPWRLLDSALSALGASWPSSHQFVCVGSGFVWTVPPRGALHGGLLHDLRDFLRSALWSRLAARRPKDFAGAESGVLRSPFIASALSSPCGPSLLSGGLWTRMRFFVWGGEPTSTCLACGLGPHTVEHALWSCPMHAVRLWQLRATISAAGFTELARGLPHSLEPCFWRCGLAPVWCDLPAALVEAIQQFVLASAQSSTRVLAFRKGVG